MDKSKVGHDTSFNRAPLLHARTLLPNNQKFSISKFSEATKQEPVKFSKPLLLPKNLKKKVVVDQTNAFSNLGRGGNVMKSQGADGSGITSTKEATSTRTPSTERLREPIPCQGRRELISLAHKAMQSSNYEAQSVPASKRKRIAALPQKMDRKIVYPTPMPLYSTGTAVAGAGLIKNKGNGKQKREGPCVGTKGFRAPEVLFRSPHQGPKLDVWSAGVTLLYLMIGRTPFTGEPEQNIKEIVKLRGNEDLWEVAKLHDCQPSFPADLHDVKFLASMKLREWCKQNTKRPEFLEAIPRLLFDLVDKCLTANPRARISAEEALRHDFFAPCHDALRKDR
ncbi:non-specific serine,threonine protein kinase [Sarracenia purpurea var. burkii]